MQPISSNELREMYQSFFESKGHIRIPGAPLVPENDPSVLFTTAGMHPLVPYLKGQPHPAGKRLTNSQVCLRTTDIDAVGDATHATVFEMLGNWSLGDYFKKDSISWSWEFLTSKQWLNLPRERFAVSVFAGDQNTPRDEESATIWQSLGVRSNHIAYLGSDDNWWPAGGKASGPQGSDTEIFYWTGQENPPAVFSPDDKHWVEIWNNVFMQFNKAEDGLLTELSQRNVDTGMGLERTIMVLNGLSSIYAIDTYQNLWNFIQSQSVNQTERDQRIFTDHIKAITFLMNDELKVRPSNTEQGYVLRKLIRRSYLAIRRLGVTEPATDFLVKGMKLIGQAYAQIYHWSDESQQNAWASIRTEIKQFEATENRGLDELKKIDQHLPAGEPFPGTDAFRLYETHGLSFESTALYLSKSGTGRTLNQQDFSNAMKEHQNKSRTATTGRFKGGLADQGTISTQYHTATHLLHQALRLILGPTALQKGSNITPERLRFDFSYPNKLTSGQIKAVERLVNETINQNLAVTRQEMSVATAKQKGALGLFEKKYQDTVSVYFIGNFSSEICGGPHISHTGELGHFTILKEESAGAGIRRIKAILEQPK